MELRYFLPEFFFDVMNSGDLGGEVQKFRDSEIQRFKGSRGSMDQWINGINGSIDQWD